MAWGLLRFAEVKYIATLLLLLGAAPASAQFAAPVGIAVSQASSAPVDGQDDSTRVNAVLGRRAVMGLFGWLPGAIIGAVVMHKLFPQNHCNCDDPGLREIVAGFIWGGSLGAAMGASSPQFGSRCLFGQRFVLATIGSALGTGAGLLMHDINAKAIAVPLLSITGATLAQWRC